MKITRCAGAEAHFFDGDKYTTCPVCGAGAASNGTPTPAPSPVTNVTNAKETAQEANPKKEKKSHWWDKKKDDKETNATVAIDSANEDSSTVMLGNDASSDTPVQEMPPKPVLELSLEDLTPKTGTISKLIPQEPQGPTDAERRKSYDSAKTVGIYSQDSGEPVVGWLVCIKGESFGESFNLKAGKNSIGRGAGMDVMLAQERTVSRDKHAVLTYEPKKRIFLIQPGDGNGLVYLNDDLLMSFSEIKNGDVIQLGEALFRFVPLCGEAFSWDDYITE